eukprot:XP_001705486.1 Hypothetical protein GL50803_90966 [Giardia lamblia ATCC 50803]
MPASQRKRRQRRLNGPYILLICSWTWVVVGRMRGCSTLESRRRSGKVGRNAICAWSGDCVYGSILWTS